MRMRKLKYSREPKAQNTQALQFQQKMSEGAKKKIASLDLEPSQSQAVPQANMLTPSKISFNEVWRERTFQTGEYRTPNQWSNKYYEQHGMFRRSTFNEAKANSIYTFEPRSTDDKMPLHSINILFSSVSNIVPQCQSAWLHLAATLAIARMILGISSSKELTKAFDEPESWLAYSP